jgi:acetyl-CoA carboxylase biotin carboxyl carrier protein
MAKASPDSTGPFDLDRLRELVEMMEEHGLTEVNLKRGDEKWRLRRGPQEVVQTIPAAPQPVAAAPAPVAASAPAATPSATESGLFINSPTVGTYYSAPSPDDPPFVKVGEKVNPDTIVCIVEAMKVFNQISAELNGTIVEILVKNGDPVEFGQALFRVELG